MHYAALSLQHKNDHILQHTIQGKLSRKAHTDVTNNVID